MTFRGSYFRAAFAFMELSMIPFAIFRRLFGVALALSLAALFISAARHSR